MSLLELGFPTSLLLIHFKESLATENSHNAKTQEGIGFRDPLMSNPAKDDLNHKLGFLSSLGDK